MKFIKFFRFKYFGQFSGKFKQGRRELSLFGLTLIVGGGFVEKPGEAKMPVRSEGGFIRLRVIQDVHSIEVYAGEGEATLCLQHVSDGLLNRVECDGARVRAWALKRIHE